MRRNRSGDPGVQRRSAAVAALGALVAALAVAAPADATSVVPLGDDALAFGAALVVHGRVGAVRTVEYPVGPGVFTEVAVEVLARLDPGDPVESLVIRVPGGASGTRRVVVSGMPTFDEGDEVVVFLEALPTAAFGDAAPAYIPFGLQQGVWRQADAGWIRGDQEGLLPSALPPASEPRTLDGLRALCADGAARRSRAVGAAPEGAPEGAPDTLGGDVLPGAIAPGDAASGEAGHER